MSSLVILRTTPISGVNKTWKIRKSIFPKGILLHQYLPERDFLRCQDHYGGGQWPDALLQRRIIVHKMSSRKGHPHKYKIGVGGRFVQNGIKGAPVGNNDFKGRPRP